MAFQSIPATPVISLNNISAYFWKHFSFCIKNYWFGACTIRLNNTATDIWNKSYMNCGNEMKMKKWSSHWTQFMQLRKEAWKKSRTSTGFEPLTSLLPVRCFTNWAMKPLSWEQVNFFHGNIWTHNWPAPYVSGFKAHLVAHRTGNREVTGSNPVEVLDFFQASLRNCINCVHCDDHFFIFIK